MSDVKFPPVYKQILVEATPEVAFKVFTEQLDRWWPRMHHIGKAAMKAAILEPRVGGRWYEVGEDGSECNWGKVLACDPPRRLVLAWQITGNWKFDPALVTEVEVLFDAVGARQTQVTLEHRNLDRFGEFAEQVTKAIGSEGGWTLILQSFAKLVEEGKAGMGMV